MRNHVSGVLPKALVSRIAISGLMPELAVDDVIERLAGDADNLGPFGNGQAQGSRQSCRTMRPDAQGFS